MRTIILILLAATIGLGVLLSKEAATIKEQQQQLAAANDRRKAESITLQAKCAQQAKLAWADTGYKDGDMANYQNHYNERLNKCFVHLESRFMVGAVGWNRRIVFDAFENKDYANYMWHTVEGKNFADVSPVECSVRTLAGAEEAWKGKITFSVITVTGARLLDCVDTFMAPRWWKSPPQIKKNAFIKGTTLAGSPFQEQLAKCLMADGLHYDDWRLAKVSR